MFSNVLVCQVPGQGQWHQICPNICPHVQTSQPSQSVCSSPDQTPVLGDGFDHASFARMLDHL